MKNDIYGSHTSSILNAEANLIALLSYLASTVMSCIPILKYVSFFAPLIVFFLEQNSGFVKFHSMQAFLLNVISSLISIAYTALLGASSVGILMGLDSLSVGMASFGFAMIISLIVFNVSIVILVYNVLAMIGAYKYKEYHIPFIGNWASNFSHTN